MLEITRGLFVFMWSNEFVVRYLRILRIQVWEVFLFDFGEVFLLFFFNLDLVGGDTFLVRSEGPSFLILVILSLKMFGIQDHIIYLQ